MKCHSRRIATVVLAVALSLSSVATASPKQQDRGRERIGRIIQVITKIQKLFGISTNDDLPQPPIPAPPPPPTP